MLTPEDLLSTEWRRDHQIDDHQIDYVKADLLKVARRMPGAVVM